MTYRVLREPRHETRQVRGLDIHLRRWGAANGRAPLVLLHGWQDSGETFQILVDRFREDRPAVAVDWRGFGDSGWAPDGYWFPDYLADLDALLTQLVAGEPARIIGHSMGGNVACLYAGLKPERVRSVVNLEGFGLPRTSPSQAPERLRTWLDQVKSPTASKDYGSMAELASLIRKRYPRFSEPQASLVANAWGRLTEDGRVHLKADPRHRWVNPVLYRREEAEACWREVKAPVLMLLGEESEYLGGLGEEGTDAAMRAMIPGMELIRVAGAGHMLHIEKPEAVAALIEQFLNTH